MTRKRRSLYLSGQIAQYSPINQAWIVRAYNKNWSWEVLQAAPVIAICDTQDDALEVMKEGSVPGAHEEAPPLHALAWDFAHFGMEMALASQGEGRVDVPLGRRPSGMSRLYHHPDFDAAVAIEGTDR